jgi:hypothetical protein
MGLDRPKMLIALGRAGFTQNRRRARRNDHPRRGMSSQHLIVNWVAIVSAIACYRTDRVLDLIQQIRQCRDVADIIRRQFHRSDFLRIGVDRQMQLAPTSARADPMFLIEPFALAVNLHPGAVDQQMQGLVPLDTLWQNLQPTAALAERWCDPGSRDRRQAGPTIDRIAPSVCRSG